MSSIFDRYKEIDQQFAENSKQADLSASVQSQISKAEKGLFRRNSKHEAHQKRGLKSGAQRKAGKDDSQSQELTQNGKSHRMSQWLTVGAVFGFVVSLVILVFPEIIDFQWGALTQIRVSSVFAKADENKKEMMNNESDDDANGLLALKNSLNVRSSNKNSTSEGKDGKKQGGEKSFFQEMSELLSLDSVKVTMEKTDVNETLEEKRREMERKERSLLKLEEEIEVKKAELSEQLEELLSLRRTISSKLDSSVEKNKKSMDKLVGVYSNMKPDRAASILSGMEESLATGILSKMKKQNAAAILNFIEPKKARSLTEKYAGMK